MKHTTQNQLKNLLEGTIEGSNIKKALRRKQDDSYGSYDIINYISVCQGPDGDMYIGQGENKWLRFRNYFGGGNSLRTHNALLILLKAIELDNQERPEQ